MILKASERANPKDLARHLMNARDNEHVELHELRGFVADDLDGAFQEAHAISRGTRCTNFLFSLSLSPPQDEDMPPEVFEAAIEDIEAKLGLEDQPRAVVFHEKEGRRHAHAVWSRIDAESMTAINLPHFKRKLNDIARDLYLQHGWEMPDGFKQGRTRDPLTYTIEEYQQAKRAGRDPKQIKALMQDAWKGSDSKATFQSALRDQGFFLAQGDRRGFVALDYRGEVYSLSRTTGAKAKDLKARLGDPKALPTVDEQKRWLSERMTKQVKSYVASFEERHRRSGLALEFQRKEMVDRHRHARSGLKSRQQERWQAEERKRAERLPRGVKGLWSWVTGKTKKIRLQNELETLKAQERDRAERHAIVQKQLSERRGLQKKIVKQRDRSHAEVAELNRDVAHYMMMGGKAPIEITRKFERETQRLRTKERSREKTRERPRGPDLDMN
ncbi:relaxase/mobilization nuclease domain-containing protein [Leisingera caerulea]|uniref:relaxase/mobilization nuclease domain-containing protein n=1 Tax=Leisingera caerulea TaxID=506591 RepID=UPI0021A56156|nr:relaxase/mobilization nuclease domain-containing protein [Leisingera caerulea]UWQ83127.1 relaxase/mobilization nuclease domain-containing protein [Leisingera caerulea]